MGGIICYIRYKNNRSPWRSNTSQETWNTLEEGTVIPLQPKAIPLVRPDFRYTKIAKYY
jgi:hypothetical protein